MFTAAFVLGDNLRRRRLHVESLADRAERAEREREILARERVAEERARIARELHDIVAHSVSVMVIQAARRPPQPDHPPGGRRGPAREHRAHRAARRWTSCARCSACCAAPTPNRWRCRCRPSPTCPSLVDTTAGLPVRLAVTGVVDHVPAGVGVSRLPHRAGGADQRQPPRRARRQRRRARDVHGDRRRRPRRGRRPRRVGVARSTRRLRPGRHERAGDVGRRARSSAGPRPGGGWRVSARFPLQPGGGPAWPPAPGWCRDPGAARRRPGDGPPGAAHDPRGRARTSPSSARPPTGWRRWRWCRGRGPTSC